MNYRNCPHYNEIVEVLSKNLTLDDVSFKIEDTAGCPECENEESSICSLWINLSFAGDISSQVGIDGPEVTIDTLEERMKEIAWALVNSYRKGTGTTVESFNISTAPNSDQEEYNPGKEELPF
jgi:hypothetical protein